ncbi:MULTISPECIES: glycosyltransferase family 25 protein [Rhodomicrobium]|uniref:glycosyltransferase family 25 protein n=1 Tax=Rhodomicrobium TaxID=1068 RepID=UPI000B4A9DE7|nr:MULTISPECIES: glycosyltransferase family 25 protein [Rhodomicrobium]
MESLPVYLINLDKDQDRLARMSAQLEAISLPFERVSAVRSTAMPDWLRPYFLHPDGSIASQMRPGEIGCYASHLVVLRTIAEGGVPALVLEDDMAFGPELRVILGATERFPAGWDIMRLSSAHRRRVFPAQPVAEGFVAVKFSRVPTNTGAYIITPKGARRFLGWKGLRVFPVDQDLWRVWDNGLVTYGIAPRVVIPAPGISSIDSLGQRASRRLAASRGSRLADGIRRLAFDIRWLGLKNWMLSLIRPRRQRGGASRMR